MPPPNQKYEVKLPILRLSEGLADDTQVICLDDDLETVLISANPNLLRPSCERIPPTLLRLTDALLKLHADNGDLNWVRAVIDELEGFDIGPQAPFVPLPQDEDTCQ